MTENGDPQYVVVVNAEEQYSVWRDREQPPAGWQAIGEPAGREQCLDRIAELWTDIRPASLRRA